jgi:hypothetical protein
MLEERRQLALVVPAHDRASGPAPGLLISHANKDATSTRVGG